MLTSNEPPIGLFGDIEYVEESLKLNSGDRVIMVTDGLYEWSTLKKEIFGWDNMVNWFEEHRSDSPDALWDQMHALIEGSRSQQGILQEDDETILILTRN